MEQSLETPPGLGVLIFQRFNKPIHLTTLHNCLARFENAFEGLESRVRWHHQRLNQFLQLCNYFFTLIHSIKYLNLVLGSGPRIPQLANSYISKPHYVKSRMKLAHFRGLAVDARLNLLCYRNNLHTKFNKCYDARGEPDDGESLCHRCEAIAAREMKNQWVE